ncbi:MAG TPA: DEAD/DEAH box helicase, partial [Candidatus Obscuribacterales bacterium]
MENVSNINAEPNIPDGLAWAHPLVAEWFISRFGSATEPQREGWPSIIAGKSTLISAPTGSGKTLAAFLVFIDRLVRRALDGTLKDATEVLYVSPLKALSNDVEKNLQVPLREILKLAEKKGISMPEIRTKVRTGDTLEADRRAMLKRPPHILVTTPESLYILLTAEGSRKILKDVETVIVDEIHAMADDKRGSHLTLSLERLAAMAWRPPVRIGLSATQKPLDTVAHFLVGSSRPLPALVNVGHKRNLDMQIETPATELGPVLSGDMWEEIYDRIAQLVSEHRSTLVFVNTRRLAERVAHYLAERLGEDVVLAHHGSLSRKIRHEAEARLKAGELKALVATASLELGIDVGAVDLVVQISSPRSIAVALQRIGRAGHWRGAIPKGRIFATTRDDLIECAALVKAINESDLDKLIVPECPLDVLAQQIVAACSTGDWKEDDLFELARKAYPYRNLTREQFNSIIEVLSEGIAASRGRFGAYLHRDRVNGVLKARRGSRLAAITNGGAIPETALYTVLTEPDGVTVGTVDEDFAVESMRGDVMLLGSTSWMIRSVESRSGRMWVKDANGAPPNIPFWRGEAPARTRELSAHVADVRAMISSLIPHAPAKTANGAPDADGSEDGRKPVDPELRPAIDWLMANCGLTEVAAEQAVNYILEGRAVLGAVPTGNTLIAERFFDEAGGMQLVIHAPIGGRINKAWGLALRKRFCKSFNLELQAAATDNGINISLTEQHSFPLSDVFRFLSVDTVEDVLRQAVLQSPIFATRFRWDANRSLALLRYQGGQKVPPQIQRMRADDLLAAVFPQAAACQDNVVGDIEVPDHPLVAESLKDALTEAMDLDGLKEILAGIKSGAITVLSVDTPVPSQFCHEILNANPYAYLDDAPLEERRARAVELRRVLPPQVSADVGRLDPRAIEQVKIECWPDVRNADEL